MKVLLRLSIVLLLGLIAGCARAPVRREQPPIALPALSESAREHAANAVLFRALSLVGTPYHYGGNTPQSGFDCSGLVGYVFRDAAGVALPRTSEQLSEIDARRLGRNQLDSGDLLFFGNHGNVSHVGIYVGKQRFVHAPNAGGTVRLDSLDNRWWSAHFIYAKRIFQ